MKFSLLILPAIFFLTTSLDSNDSSSWVLQKTEHGIKVYTRVTDGSNIKEVRVVNNVKSSLSGMVALLLDSKNYVNWIYACTTSNPIKQVSETEMYNYQVTDFPWPVTDRDLVCNFKVSQDPVTKIVSFNKTGIDGYLPEKSSYVRIKNFQSNYTLTPLSGDSVQVELEMKVDPAGDIPAWLINSNIVMAPYKSTVSMLNQIPKYQSAVYSFIKEL